MNSNIEKLKTIISDEKHKKNWLVRLTIANNNEIYNIEYVLALPNPKQYFSEKDIYLIAATSPNCCQKILDSKIYQDDPTILNKIQGFNEVNARLSLQ